jgi:hypothetical protein
MKIYYQNITYDFCPTTCIKCKHYLSLGLCPIFRLTIYYEGKRLHPTEQLDVFEL